MQHAKTPITAYQWQAQKLILNLSIQPKASRDKIVGIHNGRIKVQITAPPVDGKANQHLIAYLAHCFNTPKSRILLSKGETSKHKTIIIDQPDTLPDWLSTRA